MPEGRGSALPGALALLERRAAEAGRGRADLPGVVGGTGDFAGVGGGMLDMDGRALSVGKPLLGTGEARLAGLSERGSPTAPSTGE